MSLGGFDTHADERQLQEVLLGQLDRALTRFSDRMARTDAGRRVITAVYSEFGRRVRANGTDHGTASNMLLLGTGVRGGLYGEPPSLTDLDRGDLKVTIDFRDGYAAGWPRTRPACASRHRRTMWPTGCGRRWPRIARTSVCVSSPTRCESGGGSTCPRRGSRN
ncbi:DUF1501 domain-containing protein [Micromonospora sp. C95]|uniref:DUF1501 domain-containing protein n=1 Tax=Micromonospora sp. C95 TaxID=2824882 RepID=UPI0027DB31E7|nr:DUF1501 domain-containing protein [Micromonospora sp. C95]